MFLPMTKQEMKEHGWEQLDFLIISGDAYVDHHSFGSTIVGRWLEYLGYRVGIIAQPDCNNEADFLKMGRPRLAVLIGSGNLDSMLSHYTAAKKTRSQDAYSPGGKSGMRPDRALTVYSKKARAIFGSTMPIILGGIEASLRRYVHYDYWADLLMPSVLEDAEADLLVYGMSEIALSQIANVLNMGASLKSCYDIPGLAYITDSKDLFDRESILLPSFQAMKEDKKAFAFGFSIIEKEQNFFDGKTLVQLQNSKYVVVNKPARPLTEKEMDTVYSLPYERAWHPSYNKLGGVPAFDEVRYSLVSHRGCFGGCSFCALTFHQGRVIQSRSDAAILAEAELLTKDKNFKGNIHDVGGPTANFRLQNCKKADKYGPCRDKQCMYPRICKQLPLDSDNYEKLLTALRKLPGIKKVFIRSGLRFDYAMAEKSRSFLHTLCRNHISGQLKVAPEHIAPRVLQAMGKSGPDVYKDFVKEYKAINKIQNKEQYLVPYFMAAHPGSTLEDAILLAKYMKTFNIRPEQVQEFIPTPGTVSTCMYYTGIDPRTMKPIYVPKGEERAMQRALLQCYDSKNYDLIRKALIKAGQKELIGYGKKCLVPPDESKLSAEQIVQLRAEVVADEKKKLYANKNNIKKAARARYGDNKEKFIQERAKKKNNNSKGPNNNGEQKSAKTADYSSPKGSTVPKSSFKPKNSSKHTGSTDFQGMYPKNNSKPASNPNAKMNKNAVKKNGIGNKQNNRKKI